MPRYKVTEPLGARQRKQRSHEVLARDESAARDIVARRGVKVIEDVVRLDPIQADAVTLNTAGSLNIALSPSPDRTEAVVSVLLRISDIGRIAERTMGFDFEGNAYRAYFRAMSVESSLEGTRIKGMTAPVPPRSADLYLSNRTWHSKVAR